MSSSYEKILGLIKADRLRPATAGSTTALIASESDKGRVINSAGFRRLQQKAQVFPLDTNAAVRTRLTHSVEVSHVGRYLVQKIIDRLDSTDKPYPELAAFVNVVETACLLHDIGNPPFGHLGEASIRQWFKDNYPNSELCEFDGNPQGFRQISFLSGRDVQGLNLTCSLLLATVKYPWSPTSKPTDSRKIGVFGMDWSTYEAACAALDWPVGKPFPFMRLMEAADDISYSMSDLEDGLEKEIIRVTDLRAQFGDERFSSASVDPFIAFKTGVINQAVEHAADTFTDNLPAILNGDKVDLLSKTSEIGGLLEAVTDYARDKIYSHPAAERIELAGHQVISGLLDRFKPLIELPETVFLGLVNGDKKHLKGNDFEIRLLRLLPNAYREKYREENGGSETERRAHLIVDFIAGMTDDFALETYQALQGIRIR